MVADPRGCDGECRAVKKLIAVAEKANAIITQRIREVKGFALINQLVKMSCNFMRASTAALCPAHCVMTRSGLRVSISLAWVALRNWLRYFKYSCVHAYVL